MHDNGRIYTRDELPDAEFTSEDDLSISSDLASWAGLFESRLTLTQG